MPFNVLFELKMSFKLKHQHFFASKQGSSASLFFNKNQFFAVKILYL